MSRCAAHLRKLPRCPSLVTTCHREANGAAIVRLICSCTYAYVRVLASRLVEVVTRLRHGEGVWNRRPVSQSLDSLPVKSPICSDQESMPLLCFLRRCTLVLDLGTCAADVDGQRAHEEADDENEDHRKHGGPFASNSQFLLGRGRIVAVRSPRASRPSGCPSGGGCAGSTPWLLARSTTPSAAAGP